MRTAHRLAIAALAAAALAGVAGCGSASSPTAPAASAPATTTDTFSGSVAQLGSENHVFAVAANGTVTLSLTTVAPLSTMSLGVAVTTSDGTNCVTQISQNTDARAGAIALTGAAAIGNYCVRIFDSGNVPLDTTVLYTITVVHP
ncbi:MAG TPA: hypothetical protein VGI12_05045 [Vicinamibacterales bacterium]|jgi:hypothetical protein